MSHLPPDFRPKNLYVKELLPGLHLPCWFINEIKGIDANLHFVYHHHRIQYDDLMNQYYGSLEDPRWTIHEEYGVETWGCVLTQPDGSPIPDNTWHIWQLAKDKGWSHVANIPAVDGESLNIIVNRLGKEKLFKAKFGQLAWNKELRKQKEDREAKAQDARDQRFQDIQRENRSLTKVAMENLARGVTRPSNPTKEIVTSYSGQTNRSKIVRPLTDKEGGLVTGDE